MSDTRFIHLLFLRLDGAFHNLESNERLVAKQAFLGTWESYQNKMSLLSYSLTGLRADCDILMWRAAESLELLQDMQCRLQSSGLGKFLIPAYSYLLVGTPPDPEKSLKYLFIRHGASPSLAKPPPGLRPHPEYRRGLDEGGPLWICEAQTPEEYLKTVELEPASEGDGGPRFCCLLKDIRDLVDCLG